jgi:3-methyl-2-oxobutanoate hydroxymethyltransferase
LEKVTLHTLRDMKKRGERIAVLTAYDYPTGLLVDRAGIDLVLVGDSAGMVVHGYETTLPVTLDMMIVHCQAVRRGVQRALVVGDMPFMTYQVTEDEAKRNAARMLSEGGADAVKIEGGEPMASTVRALVSVGIAVQGHIGLTPQSVRAFGGMRIQGRALDGARQIVRDAEALAEAGAFSIVLEGIPARLAGLITRRVDVPTIGIGAGAGCDGQVLVTHDLLGLFDRFTPTFVKRYAEIGQAMQAAFEAYRDDVRSGAFPSDEHSFSMDDEVWDAIEAEFGD